MSIATPRAGARIRQWRRARAGIVAASLLAIAAVGLAPVHSPAAAAATVQRQSFADLVERVQPAVVNVATKTRIATASAEAMPFQFPEGSPFAERFREFFERRFHGAPRGGEREAQGVGSGFIIDSEGHVVTNNHVIKGADEIIVTLDDGTELAATVVGRDEKTDLALLKVDAGKPLPFVAFGDSTRARVGDWVVAVGSPFGLGGTVTAGIISARGRDIRSGPFDDFLQVDAPINRGNSGGPLFDQDGNVIGVNTAIFSPSGGNVGIGFAIPSELAAQVVSALKSDGRVDRGWMGVSIQALSPELAQSFGLKEPRGALVAGVLEGGPADRAGVKVGDVITRFDGKPIENMRELPRVVAAARAGTTVQVEVMRDGSSRTLDLHVGNMPGTDMVASGSGTSEPDELKLGVALAQLDEKARAHLGLEDGVQGVLITKVAPGSPAASQGLRAGDLILRVGNEPVKSPEQVAAAVRQASKAKRERVLMLVSRNGNERFVAVPFARS